MMVFMLCFTFVFGTIVGSLLNVCIYRIPLEKSLLWPGSRCGSCLQSVRWYDNIPLLSYLILCGRCRACQARFSPRYFLVELLTGLCFAGLFYLEIVLNVFDIGLMAGQQRRMVAWHIFPNWEALVFTGYHALLVSFLIVITFCDLDHREIPMSITLTGTVFGLIGATLFPWPWPSAANVAAMQAQPAWIQANPQPLIGLFPWPVWLPLPAWLPPGTWQLGLATGVVGLLVGTLMLRVVRFLFSTGLGMEALGLGDADLMMMAGSFLGWQPLIVAFFISVIPGLLFALVHLTYRRQIAQSPRTIALQVGFKDHQLAIELDGQPVGWEELGPTCGRLVTEARKKRVMMDTTDLDELLIHAVSQVEEAVNRAGIRHVSSAGREEPQTLLGRFAQYLFGFLRNRTGPSVTVEVFPKENQPAYRIDGEEVITDLLYEKLRDFAKDKAHAEARIDSLALEKWLDRTLGQIRMAACAAGVPRIYRRDNAIPFGPALAVGLVLSLLAWPWFVAHGNLGFLFFNAKLLFGLAGSCAVIMLVSSYAIRVVRMMRG